MKLSQGMINLVYVGILVAIVICTSASAKVNGGDWTRPFDGMTLEGWEVRGGFAKYRVENREIVGTSVEGSPNTFLCTKKQYGDFFLEFEVKCDTRLNSGVQVRSHVYKKDTTLEMLRRGQKRKVVRKAGHVYG
ncbi:MAG: 3-keto-disaccharide hydrolase, partial [Planctomycetota bacterium]